MDMNDLIRDAIAADWKTDAAFLRDVQAAMWEAIDDIDCYSRNQDLCISCWSKESNGHDANCGAQETINKLRKLAGPNG